MFCRFPDCRLEPLSGHGTEKILSVGTTDAVGKVIAIGEATIANYQGTEYLYFVYGIVRGFDSTSGLPDINMQAGFIKKR